jgi:hypothetical protein
MRFIASPPSWIASEEPVVAVPIAVLLDGAFHSSARIDIPIESGLGGQGAVIQGQTVGERTAGMDGLGHGILVLVDEVLRYVLHHELVRGIGHPDVNKGREVENRRSVEGKFIVNQLVGLVRINTL